ncbi:hypothetical protein BH09PLA1_BH09PLA1_24990 [soil metagenome]
MESVWYRVAMVVLAASGVARAEIRYQVTELGDLGQHFADPYALNELGHVAGVSARPQNQIKPFFWSSTTGMVDFSPSGNPGSFPTGFATGINDLDQVVGYRYPDAKQYPRAFVWSSSAGFQTLGTLGGPDSYATAINNAGQITGYAGIPNGLAHAFVYDPANGMRDIATLSGNSYARSINENGQVAGMIGVDGQAQAFRWRDETGMVLLGTLGGILSQGYGINNAGHVVGMAATAENGGNFTGHAFLYDETGMHDLGTLGDIYSEAAAINDRDEVVGYSYIHGDQYVRGFIHDGTTMRDLNDLIDPASGWRISLPHDINNAGQIVALALGSTEPWAHAVLVTPIPEPAVSTVALAGCVGAMWKVRRRVTYRASSAR